MYPNLTMPDDYPPVTQASVDAAIAEMERQREEYRRLHHRPGFAIVFDLAGHPRYVRVQEQEAE